MLDLAGYSRTVQTILQLHHAARIGGHDGRGAGRGDVAREMGERQGIRAANQVAVLLHGRAAAGRVDYDGVEAAAEEGDRVLSSKVARDIAFAAVHVQGAATDLVARDVDLAAVVAEH